MPDQAEPTDHDLANIKTALVSAGFLKAVTVSKEDEEKILAALRAQGADAELRSSKIICSRAHWCIVIKR